MWGHMVRSGIKAKLGLGVPGTDKAPTLPFVGTARISGVSGKDKAPREHGAPRCGFNVNSA